MSSRLCIPMRKYINNNDNRFSNPLNIGVNFHDVYIKFSDTAKLLGVNFDSHLDFCPHADGLCININKSVHAIRILQNSLWRAALLTSFLAIIQSIIGYREVNHIVRSIIRHRKSIGKQNSA